MKSVEALPPGLYAMHIAESKGADGKPSYEVSFTERRLEDVAAQLNRFERADEKPFEAVEAVSEFNQRAYELFARPLVEAFATEYGAKLSRELHPLRAQRWMMSDLNPWLGWVAAAAQMTKAQRQALPADDPGRRVEAMLSEVSSASLDYYRAIRDAISEAAFFQIYGNLFSLYLADKPAGTRPAESKPVVKKALASISQGGYPEALARVAFLLSRKGEPLPLSQLELKQELMDDYREFLQDIPRDEQRRIRGEQEIIVGREPEKAIATLPRLLAKRTDRDRLVALLDRLLADRRVQSVEPSADQLAMLERIRGVLASAPARPHRSATRH
jgi:hypothetical protein